MYINSLNIADTIKSKVLDQTLQKKTAYSRIFYFGQVINNKDPQNLNRIQVRIPVIDDIYYLNSTKTDGDSKLPFCLPASNRYEDSPENNSIVVVAIFDTKTPYFGRLYFNSLSNLSATDLFERLTPEEQSLSNWLNANNSLNINTFTPTDNLYNVNPNINYKMGIRGRGNNKIELNQFNLIIVQNYKQGDNETSITLTKNYDLSAADQINILSKKGYSTHYHPVFDKTLYNYLDAQMVLIQKIVAILNTSPAISPVGPCIPGKHASQ